MLAEKLQYLARDMATYLHSAELMGLMELPEREGTLPAAFVAWRTDRECGTHMAIWDEQRTTWRFDTGHYFTVSINAADPLAAALADMAWRTTRNARLVNA